MKIAIIYYSQTGHTREMGSVIAEGVERAGGEARLFSVEEPVDEEYVNSCDGVIIGTPPSFPASFSFPLSTSNHFLICQQVLASQVGVYATAHYAQGGGDVALMNMIGHMLVKGMLLYSGGASLGKPFIHLGPVALDSVGTHFEDCKEDFRIYGERFARKVGELFEK